MESGSLTASPTGISPPTWRVVGVSVAGPSHTTAGLPCQDACFTEIVDGRILVAAVSDGAGSARHAQQGSGITSHAAVAYLSEVLARLGGVPLDPRPIVEQAILSVRAKLEVEAVTAPGRARLQDYHATLVGCLADADGGWFFHVGDGAALAAPRSAEGSAPDWSRATVSPPANGEHANETFFVTLDDWASNLRLTHFPAAQTIALMSDGVTPFAMAEAAAAPDERFLGPVDQFLAAHDQETSTQALIETLRDERARKVSGDDKTLVWARLGG
jgi:hypothetical protein